MNRSFAISFEDESSFIEHWSSKYDYPADHKYTNNIGKTLTNQSLQDLFEWKNGSVISKRKAKSILQNYPVNFEGNLTERYLNHKESGGAIWNIFYLHCIEPQSWPIFDQHTFRAMRYLKEAKIKEIGTTGKQKYSAYLNEYIPFLNQFTEQDRRKLDRALFSFGQFLKLAGRYA